MATNEEVKQALRDALAADYASDAAVESAANDVMDLVQDTPVEPTNAVEEAVVTAISTKGLAETFGEEALVAELEDLGYTVSAPGTGTVEPTADTDFEDSDFEEPVTSRRR